MKPSLAVAGALASALVLAACASDPSSTSASGVLKVDATDSGCKVSSTSLEAGTVAEAKALFPVARTYWERIEPVAEKFGDLDPVTDGREPDAKAEGTDFTGWHRIEKQLWVAGNTDGMAPYADQLLANVKK